MLALRLSQWAWRHHLRPVALALKALVRHHWRIDVHPGAVAGRGLVLGRGVTITGGDGPHQPWLGADVTVGEGATIVGPVAIGDDARIAANAYVVADVPSGHQVAGIWTGI